MGFSIKYVNENGGLGIVPLFAAGINVEYDEELELEGSVQTQLETTILYNQIYRDELGMNLGDMIHGCKGIEIAGLLAASISLLGTKRHDCVWMQTKGNAGYILKVLLKWVSEHPNNVFVIE